jgi:hypothetical protein
VSTTLEDLERRLLRVEQDRAVEQRVMHLGNAVDTLSGDLRALGHEMRAEITPRLDAIETRLGGLESGINRLLEHFGLSQG